MRGSGDPFVDRFWPPCFLANRNMLLLCVFCVGLHVLISSFTLLVIDRSVPRPLLKLGGILARLSCLTFRLIAFYCFCRILADPGIVRDGSGTSFLGPRVDSGPRGGAFEGVLDPPASLHIYLALTGMPAILSNRYRAYKRVYVSTSADLEPQLRGVRPG